MGNETARLQATPEPKHMKESRFLSMAEPNEWLTNEWLLPNNSWLLPNKLACQRYMFAVQLRWLLFDFRWQRHAVNVCFSSKVVSFQHQDMQKTRRTSEVVRAAFFHMLGPLVNDQISHYFGLLGFTVAGCQMTFGLPRHPRLNQWTELLKIWLCDYGSRAIPFNHCKAIPASGIQHAKSGSSGQFN